MAGDERIHFKVSPEQKKRWQEHADDEYRSLSDLIRKAVERDIATDGDDNTGESVGVPDELQRDIDTINSTLAKLTDDVNGVKRELRDVKSAVEKPDSSVQDVADELIHVLPESRGEPTDAEIEAVTNPDHPKEAGNPPTTVAQLAEELDEPADVVRDAIGVLETETYMIRSSDHDGTTHYWRDE